MTLADRILGILDHATPQQPMHGIEILDALLAHGVGSHDALHALDAAVHAKLIGTARITRNTLTQDVYWPTGLKTPALAGIKPKEPITVPKPAPAPAEIKPDTKAQQLIKAIVAGGPISGPDLAEVTGIKQADHNAVLASPLKNGTIAMRRLFLSEHGREIKHYMTAHQAAEWDANHETPAAPAPAAPAPDAIGHVMSHPDAETLRDLNAEIHALRNDLAARDLILHAMAEKLHVTRIEDIPAALDDLTHALATRATTAQAPAGKPALLLIDSADLTEVEMLGEDDDAQAMAMSSIELGHAARVLVVRIVGEATRRVEWKEAA